LTKNCFRTFVHARSGDRRNDSTFVYDRVVHKGSKRIRTFVYAPSWTFALDCAMYKGSKNGLKLKICQFLFRVNACERLETVHSGV